MNAHPSPHGCSQIVLRRGVGSWKEFGGLAMSRFCAEGHQTSVLRRRRAWMVLVAGDADWRRFYFAMHVKTVLLNLGNSALRPVLRSG